MQKEMNAETGQDTNAEAVDTLIAISVVAKVLADKLKKEKGDKDEQDE